MELLIQRFSWGVDSWASCLKSLAPPNARIKHHFGIFESECQVLRYFWLQKATFKKVLTKFWQNWVLKI